MVETLVAPPAHVAPVAPLKNLMILNSPGSTHPKPPPVSEPEASSTRPAAVTVKDLPAMLEGIMSAKEATHLEATTQFRKLLSLKDSPPVQDVINTGVLPRLIHFLGCDQTPALQLEAAWALTNIASGTSDQTSTVVEAGAIPIFVRLLSSSDDSVREQSAWALGNIAGDSPVSRNQVLEAGAMHPLLQQLTEKSKLPMLRIATWTLSNFCRGKPRPDFNLVRAALPTLAKLIHSTDEEVLTDACWALSYLSDGPNDSIQAVLESGVVKRLVELLSHDSLKVQTPTLRALGNIVTGDDLQTQIVINFRALPAIIALLDAPTQNIKKEACWTLSNITAGNRDQIQAVIDAGGVPPLINLLKTADSSSVKKEAAYAIGNLMSMHGNLISTQQSEHIKLAVDCGCFEPFYDFLGAQGQDQRVVMMMLEGIENILKVGANDAKASGGFESPLNRMAERIFDANNGIAKLEQLQRGHALYNDACSEKAGSIIRNYFSASFLRDMERRSARLYLRRLRGVLRAYVVLRRMRLRAAEVVYAPGGAGFEAAMASYSALAAGLGCES